MPNVIDATGLTIMTLDEVQADLIAAFQGIYSAAGEAVDLSSSTPDGQLLQVFAQMILDALELDQQIYASFDPDQAIGRTLDMRCALNGVKRQGGSYTLQEVAVTTDRALTLSGLDAAINDPNGGGYTVSDSAGNQFILANTYAVPGAGTFTLAFRARSLGAISTTPNTIQSPVTVVIGVTGVNNPNGALSTGRDEEQDGALKIRRRKAVSIASKGFADAIEAQVENQPGVVYARCHENDTSGTDADGIPAHSIWVVVEGGADLDIARAIYARRSGGCGMRGAVSVPILRANGLPLTISFDRVATVRLYASMFVNAISGNLATTGNLTSGSNTITNIPSTAGMQAGFPIRSTHVPAGSRILSVDSTTQIKVCDKAGAAANATGTAVAEALTVVPIAAASVQAALATGLAIGISQTVTINDIASIIRAGVPNALVSFPTGTGFSADNVTFAYQLTPATKNLQFTLAQGDVSIL